MIKLYDEDAYATCFEADVVSCEQLSEGVYGLILDRTLFFPEEGGQSPDKGIIDGVEVLDVQISGDIVTHKVSKSFSRGTSVKGEIDWEHRFSNMQQHSGEHIFSGLVHKEYGYENVGFHLSDNIVTMDFSGPLSVKQVEDLEWKVNKAIAENVEITARYPSKEELADLSYRSKIELEGPVRIVTVENYDVCACCAPHVKRSGEIGLFKVMNVQSYKGGVRISMLCGFRALTAFRQKQEVVTGLTNLLSASQEQIVERVAGLKEQLQAQKLEVGRLKQDALLSKVDMLPKDLPGVILFEEDLDPVILRKVVNILVERYEGYCGIFVGNDPEGYRFVLGSSTENCSELAVRMREQLGAKGGGSKEMIQGSVAVSRQQLEGFFS